MVRLAEPGGRAIEREITLPVAPEAPMIGVKPLFAGKSLNDNDTAKFDVVMVAPDGKQMAATGLKWQLLNVESKYQWYRSNGYWAYEPIKVTRRIADGTLDLTGSAPGKISVPVTWGRYRLEVTSPDPQGPETTVGFDLGWYAEASADTPDLLEIALDKPEYKAGDTMTVAVTARSAGKVTLSVIGDRLITQTTTEVEPGLVKLPLTVGEDWGTGAYVLATLRRPLDEAEKRMPGRAIGVQWFSVDKQAHTIGVALDLAAEDQAGDRAQHSGQACRACRGRGGAHRRLRRRCRHSQPHQLQGARARRVLSRAAQAVGGDPRPLRPADRRHARHEGRDQNRRRRRRRGAPGQPADASAARASIPASSPPGLTARPKSSFDIPAFSGTVRVMAVAWSKDKTGHASGDVIVRDPVVVTATLPRFLLSGDKSTFRLDLDNVEGPSGAYEIAVKADGPLSVEGAGKSLTLDAKKRGAITLRVSATGIGTGTVAVAVNGPDGFSLSRSYALTVRPATQILARRTVKPLEPGQSITLASDVFADLVPGTGKVALSVTPTAALDVATLIAALDRYPLGCTEQIVSRALPLLYLSELSAGAGIANDAGIDERIAKAIEIVLARQGSEGAFGLWSPGGDDAWFDAYVTDFLTRARARSFSVPDDQFKLALDRLRNYVSTAPDVATDGGLALSYALYVLARNGMAPVGDLRYIADVKLDNVATPAAKAEIGAALAMLGDRVRAEKAFDAALGALPADTPDASGRTDYGSPLRDAATLVTLAAEGDAAKVIFVNGTKRIETARDRVVNTSTQENAWLVLAARALGKQNIDLSVNDSAATGPLYRSITEEELGQGPMRRHQ